MLISRVSGDKKICKGSIKGSNVLKAKQKPPKAGGFRRKMLVEVTRFELATFWSRTKRATKLRYTSIYGANEGTRTLDLRFTKPLLYLLSYVGTKQQNIF